MHSAGAFRRGRLAVDAECLRDCAGEADERISLDSVRQALAKIPGSLTADFVQERADR
jgi:hypothetical protein